MPTGRDDPVRARLQHRIQTRDPSLTSAAGYRRVHLITRHAVRDVDCAGAIVGDPIATGAQGLDAQPYQWIVLHVIRSCARQAEIPRCPAAP